MFKIRAKLFSVLIWIALLASIGLYTTFYTGQLSDIANETVALKSAANDLILAISDINNILALYSVSELTTTTTTTTTTEDLKNRQKALKTEYEFAVSRIDKPLEILKSSEDYMDRATEADLVSHAFSNEANIIFELIDKRLEEEGDLINIMGEIRENRHKITDVIKIGSRGSEKLKLDVANVSYKEKEYNFQYQDKKHADEWLVGIDAMIIDLKKEGFTDLEPFARDYSNLARQAIDKRNMIKDSRLNEGYHLELIKNNVITTDISISKIIDELDKNLNEISGRSARQRMIFFSLIFIASAFSGFFIFLATRSIVRSISNLSETAQKISTGDLSQRSSVKTKDEIGFLGLVFNRMIDDLDKRNKYVQLLRDVATAANGAKTIDEVFQIAVDKLCFYKGWPVGHVFILSRDTPDLMVPADIWHLDDPEKFRIFKEVTGKITFSKGIGLPGRILADGKLVWIDDVTKDPNFPRAKMAENIAVRSAFGLPIVLDGKVIAVLEFFSPKKEEKDEEFLEVIAGVGFQINRAMERIISNNQLKERLAELEKFKKLVVGRELKMVELKEEIEILKKKLEIGN